MISVVQRYKTETLLASKMELIYASLKTCTSFMQNLLMFQGKRFDV